MAICGCADMQMCGYRKKIKRNGSISAAGIEHQNGRKLVNTLSYKAETCIPKFGIPVSAY
jgi:hypothetical protein